jgi:hypothetical protein
MLVRTLTAVTGGLAAGLVIGAKVPVVAPSRADSMEVRMASCVLASMVVHAAAEPAANGPVTTSGPISVSSRVAA